MKILRLIPSLNPRYGGTVESVKQSSLVLISAGQDIEIATMDEPYEKFITAFPCKVNALGGGNGGYSYSGKYLNWLQNSVSEFDCVIVEGIWQFHSFAARKVCLANNIPYYVFVHGMLAPWFKQQYPLKHLKKWAYWILAEYWVLRDATHVIFTTQEERLLARESFWLYHCSEAVVTHSIDGVQGSAEEHRSSFFSYLPQLKDKPYLLYLSRIHPIKGIDLLIKAYAENKILSEQYSLVIAGPDKDGLTANLQTLADRLGVGNKIIWTGMLKDKVKWGALLAADAFVLPSHQENFGVVVTEALSCAVPVLISNKVNIWREIEADHAGIITEDSKPGFAYVLDQWANMDLEKKQKMRKCARNCFVKRFSTSSSSNHELLNLIS